ncbi:hypothetical protein BDN72DRAFT_459961 [Pluteus cervinus]|uniref:Uncharacterized protein n=1 Tax=Pluteus cervinus TaxID=181527 RepID=A0ACD3A6U8_9AGAR|nr:hypothetical protein BDN72DRAFT_459961 [Pluteus cervinus]
MPWQVSPRLCGPTSPAFSNSIPCQYTTTPLCTRTVSVDLPFGRTFLAQVHGNYKSYPPAVEGSSASPVPSKYPLSTGIALLYSSQPISKLYLAKTPHNTNSHAKMRFSTTFLALIFLISTANALSLANLPRGEDDHHGDHHGDVDHHRHDGHHHHCRHRHDHHNHDHHDGHHDDHHDHDGHGHGHEDCDDDDDHRHHHRGEDHGDNDHDHDGHDGHHHHHHEHDHDHGHDGHGHDGDHHGDHGHDGDHHGDHHGKHHHDDD